MAGAEDAEALEEEVDWADMPAKAAELAPASPVVAHAKERTVRWVNQATMDVQEILESGAVMDTQGPSPLHQSRVLERSLRQDAVNTI